MTSPSDEITTPLCGPADTRAIAADLVGAPGRGVEPAAPRLSVLPYLEILNVIGGSRRAVAYLARWRAPGHGLAVVKRWLATGRSGEWPEAAIRRLLQLDHPHIAAIFDVGQDSEGHLYSVTEYVPGSAIRRFCSRRATPKARLELLLQMIAALQYAHARGVCHLHLTSSNVIVSRATGVKLVDFNAATPAAGCASTAEAMLADAAAAAALARQVLADGAAAIASETGAYVQELACRLAAQSGGDIDLRDLFAELAESLEALPH